MANNIKGAKNRDNFTDIGKNAILTGGS